MISSVAIPYPSDAFGGRDDGQQVGEVGKQRHGGEQAHGQRSAVMVAADECGA
jgi:hypothetical protein